MQKIIVFTDTHICDAGENIIGLDPSARFLDGLAKACSAHLDAEQIIITGDLTHHGRVSQYERLKDHLADCPLSVTLMLGNHDDRANFLQVFPDAPLTQGGFVQSHLDVGEARLICLGTLDGSPRPADIHSGFLCPDRLNHLRSALDGAKLRPVVLFTHHPPYDTGFTGMDSIGLRNKDDLIALLKSHNAPVQIISGHVHRTLMGHAHGIPLAMFKSTCHQQPLSLGVSDLTASVDEPGAYGLLLVSPQGVIALSEDFTLPSRNIASF